MTKLESADVASRTASEDLAVANAPCSYGAFEITVGVEPNVPDPVALLDHVASAGYAGIDLGPVGYLGTGVSLRRRLQSRGLGLAGGYLGLPFADSAALSDALPALDELLDTFDLLPDTQPRPKPTLADAGSAVRSRYPGRAAVDRSVALDDRGWQRFGDGLNRVAERCRDRDYEPTFHHHTATFVEAQWEIERMLELSDVGLCLDTGHLLLGRGEPVGAIRAWAERINHFHLKDARLGVLKAIVDEAAPVEAIWRRRAFCALGEGDVPIDSVLEALCEVGYAGWVVVEQDLILDATEPVEGAFREQQANREFLRARGL